MHNTLIYFASNWWPWYLCEYWLDAIRAPKSKERAWLSFLKAIHIVQIEGESALNYTSPNFLVSSSNARWLSQGPHLTTWCMDPFSRLELFPRRVSRSLSHGMYAKLRRWRVLSRNYKYTPINLMPNSWSLWHWNFAATYSDEIRSLHAPHVSASISTKCNLIYDT